MKTKFISLIFYLLLTLSSVYVLLDTFVIPQSLDNVVPQSKEEELVKEEESDLKSTPSSQAVITENSYHDENISIEITTERVSDTTYYVADISLSSATYLQTALANDTYGRNIKEATSSMAEAHDAIFAINGDYYGFRDYGFVIRNGVLYREVANTNNDALVIDVEGNFSIVNESEISAQTLLDNGAWQVLSFGPALIENSEIVVGQNEEVAQAMTSNPRTAIGQIDELHYIVVVSDGRTSESEGLSLYELAEVMASYQCTTAYNLDGGGSSTMYFNGEIVNHPTNGRSSGERSVSDIVYIGY